jgi:hypothetical protein
VQTTTINSYLYQQYNDDDDLQALVDAYNQATQVYVTWFATIGLPIYTALSGPLLDWCAEGIYGLTRTSLASPASLALGPFNTETFGSDVFNGYTPSARVVYALTDDLFQRILTWDFYKGDGKRFTLPWLKRRIMRFLLGVNGTDPQPWLPGFQVGAETTNAISVVVVSHVLTVTIYESLLSVYAEITPAVLSVFQTAFLGGALELPLQYTYQCNIIAPLVAVVSPDSWTLTSTSTTQTTGASVVTTVAGSGSFTFSWGWSNTAFINVNSPASAVTTFSLTGGVLGQVYTSLAICIVTDLVTGQTAQCSVHLSFTCVAAELLVAVSGANGLPLLIAMNGISDGPILLS